MSLMADAEHNPLSNLLHKLGFKALHKGTAAAWHWDHSEVPPSGRAREGKHDPAPAWRVDVFSLAEKKNYLAITQLDLQLDRMQFKRNIEDTAKRHFGPKTTCEVLAADDGDVHVLFEFVRPGSRENSKGYKRAIGREMPYGIGGYRLRFVSEGARITAVISGLFGFGYVPTTFISGLHRHIAEALSLRSKSLKFLRHHPESIFEFSFHVADVAISCLAARRHGSPASLTEVHQALTQSAKRARDMRRTGLQTTCVAEESVWRMSSVDGSHQGAGRRSLIGYVPVEVLEARERRKDHAGLDDLFLQGKFDKAAEEVGERLRILPGSLYLTRRWCILNVLGRLGGASDIAGAGLALEPGNVLFLSSRVNTSLAEGNMRGVLENLSRLGEVLLRIIPQAERARCFDVVLPELLGDAWNGEDAAKAAECYSRIIQKRGDLPRILRKLIGLALAEGQAKEEEKYLERLATVERRRIELAKIHRRLAEIRSLDPGKLFAAVEDALLAVDYDRQQIESALLAKDLLIKLRRPEEAIQLLDGLLRDASLELAGRARARLEAHIAGIWLRDLNRPDLAEGRYRQALSYDPENIDALRDLEAVHRASGDTESLITILERQFTALERDRDLDSLRHVLRSLVDLYRHQVGRPAQALELYRRALDSIPIAPEDIDQLLTWPDMQIDWRSYYIKLAAKIQEIASKKERGQYLCRLADLCRSKLNDTKTARLHYLDALHEGVIDTNGFHFLVNHLTSERDYERLAKCYELRLEQVAASHRAEIIFDYLNVPQVLTDEKRDQLALEAYTLQPETEHVLQQRFTYYQSMDDVEGIGRLIREILAGPESSRFQKSLWLEQAVQVLAACIDPLRFALMDNLYRELFDYSEDRERILLDAVRELGPSQDAAILSRYLGELLDMGILPSLEERAMRTLLVGQEKRQAQYEMLRSQQESDSIAAASFARTAAALYRNLADHKAEEKALARVCMLVPADESDLAALGQLTSDSKHHDVFTKVLEKQIAFETDPRRKYELLRTLGELYRHNLKRPDLALGVYRRALGFTHRGEAIKWHMAGLAREAKDVKAEVSALLSFVGDPHAEMDKVQKGLKRLGRLGSSLQTVKNLLEERTQNALAASDIERAEQLIEVLIVHKMGSPDLFQTAFEVALDRNLDDMAISVWWRGLSGMNSRSDVERYIAFASGKWEQVGRPSLMLDCFRAGLSGQIKEHVNHKVYREFLCQYGLKLFDDDGNRKKATVVFQEVFEIDPAESRIWMPLYFLLTDYGQPQQRLTHLDAIVPALEADPRPLRSFPLTLESLKAERAELTAQLSGVPRQPVAAFSDFTEVTGINRKPRVSSFGEETQEPTSLFRPITSPPKADDVMVEGDEPSSQALPMVAGEPSFAVASFDLDEPVSESANFSIAHQADARAFADDEPSIAIDMGFAEMGEFPAAEACVVPPSPPQEEAAKSSENIGNHLSLVVESDPPGEELSMVVDMNEMSRIADIDFQATSLGNDAANLPPLMDLENDEGTSLDLSASSSEDEGLKLDFATEVMESVPEHLPSEDFAPPSGLPDVPPMILAADDRQAAKSLYGNLFDDGHDDKPAPEPDVVDELPQAVDSEGPGEFRIDMTNEEREQTGQASSVELAAALGMDGDAEEPAFVEEALSAEQVAEQPTALMASEADAEGATQSTNSSQLQTVDWRPLVKSGRVDAKLTRKLINQAFVNEIEKHIALQSVAVLGSSVQDLNNWHWRVWRKPEEFGYPLRVKDRYPESAQPEILQSSLAKLVLATAPIFVRLYRRRFTTEYLSRKLQTPVEAIERMRQPLGWNEGPTARCGFKHYADRIKKRGYRLFDMPGLQSKVFYEGKHRTIYLDRKYYEVVPPSHLFHRILGILWAVRLHYFVPLTLNPQKDVLPVMAELGQHFTAQGISLFTSRLRGQSEVIKCLKDIDTKQLKELFGRVGVPRLDALNQLWFSMQTQIYSIILAETLDLVGLMESLVDRDLLDTKKPLLPGEVLQLSPYARHMIDFMLKMSRDS